MNNIEKLAIEQQPQIKPLWLVIDEQGYPIHCASYKEACNEHINDAINDFDLTDAKYWKVVEAVPKALQSSEPVAKPDAWLVPSIIDFNKTKNVHFTRSEKGKHLTDSELKAELQGTVIWGAEAVFINDSNEPVTDKNGVKHYPKPLYTGDNLKALLDEDTNTLMVNAVEMHNTILALQATNKKLLDALRYYDECKFFITHPDGRVELIDHGCVASKAIAEAEGKEG